ncbi:MAG: tetratricopeptide repeat protein [Deltaproteobacteria bacterium]|nr:tetratricopeptide repeat protein [Deltaproteobacteria bacterium]MBW1861683.1 tetratricopeptide repeat protein [Deltaproteobacteria bacterium]
MWQQLWQWFLEPANQKLYLSIIAALIIGFFIGRLARFQKEKKAKSMAQEGDQAFFKGIQYILSNDHDQAIEEFTKSVQVNSDTIETYVALGNLYRSKGDIDRAMHIRQSIILRPHIDEHIKIRTLFDLGLDYRKGGFLDRAIETFLNVLQKQPSNMETLEEIEKIYEEMKDWEKAFATRQKIARIVKGDHGHILAHHQTEMGKAYQVKGELSKAKPCFKLAISIHEKCVDAYLHLGDHYFSRQEYKKAITAWKKVVRVAPQLTFLAYRRLEGAYSKMKNLKPVEDFLKECAQLNSDAFTHLALARYLCNKQDYDGALRELESALSLNPSFWEARKFMGEILLAQEMKEEALFAYRDLITRLNVPYLKFQCANCGFRPAELLWQCPQCKKWDTINFMDSITVESTSPQQLEKPISEFPQNNTEE